VIAVLSAVIIALLASFIMKSYGKDFASGTGTLIALSAAAALSASASVIGQAIASKGWMWWGFILNLIWGSNLIVFCLLLVDHGALGLASANVIAYALHLLMVVLFTFFILRKSRKERVG
jgi:O-antigen/teichoic acid export membrane protein